MTRDERSKRIYSAVHAATVDGLKAAQAAGLVPMRREAEMIRLARAAANAAVEQDEREAQERLDVIRTSEGSPR